MAFETYSVQTLIVDNGENVKGTLVLSLDKYEFNGMTKPINWEKASCTRGTSTVKSLIFSSEKPHVVICEGDNYGPAFVLDQTQADLLVAKVAEFGEIVKQNRLAEEERLRREEEERKKREEERKAREALERKIENRKKRIVEEVEKAKAEPTEVSLTKQSDLAVRKALAYIVDNPYRILGVSVSATNEEANSSLDKMKKLARLNAIASFKSNYHLLGTEKPERDLSILQNALTITKDMRHKWFWFADTDACIAWQNDSYRREILYDGEGYGTYDQFLANYVYALAFDPTFKRATLWRPVFTFYGFICNESSHALIKSRFNEKELKELRVMDAVRSFKTEIFKPLEALCEVTDAKKILRLYKILKEISDNNLDAIKKTIASKLSKWFTSREEVLCKLVADSDEDRVITYSEAREIKAEAKKYCGEVEPVIEEALSAVKGENVRYEMLKESYRHAMWQVMFALNKADERDDAITYANKCYPYCTEDDRRKIRNAFGFTAIKGADRDATNAEWDIMGDNYYEGKNGYEQDYYEAYRWYKKAAESGNKYSQNSLGICYKTGNGTYQSDYEAARWFEKAYRNGNADGAYNLARCYLNGDGKSRDKNKAIELYLEAAKLGHPTAAEEGKRLLDLMLAEQKLHRLTQHEHYDIGYQYPYGKTIIVEVELNYSANIYLCEGDAYQKYIDGDNFSYYGGRATQSPYRVIIPSSGHWHLIIDNGDDDMTGIHTSVRTRTLDF